LTGISIADAVHQPAREHNKKKRFIRLMRT